MFCIIENISLERLDNSHENGICCRGHFNVNVSKKTYKFIVK